MPAEAQLAQEVGKQPNSGVVGVQQQQLAVRGELIVVRRHLCRRDGVGEAFYARIAVPVRAADGSAADAGG